MLDDEREYLDGDLIFKHRYSSIPLEESLKSFSSFEEFEKYFKAELIGEDLLLGEYLYHLLDKYNANPYKASIAIGRSHSYVGKIVNGKELNPSRDVLLALCVYMGATVKETQILLKYAGKASLYVRRKRDVIVWFALMKHQSLDDLNMYLYDNGYDPLIKIIVRKE